MLDFIDFTVREDACNNSKTSKVTFLCFEKNVKTYGQF